MATLKDIITSLNEEVEKLKALQAEDQKTRVTEWDNVYNFYRSTQPIK